MSEPGDKPLDPWMRAALLAEGLDGGPTDAQRARMAGKLAAALGLSAAALLGSGGGGPTGGDGGGAPSGDGGGTPPTGDGGASPATAGAVAASKPIALIVGALIAGGGIGAAISELRPRSQPAIPESSAPRDAATPIDAPDIDAPMPIDAPEIDAPIDAREVPHARVDAGPMRAPDAGATMTADDLARERQLIDVARSALRGGDLQLSSKSLIEHGMRFPSGALVEEQRVLSIELAVAKGDLSGAKSRATAFRRDYPQSVFRARVDELVGP